LGVGLGSTRCIGVDAGVVLVVAETRLESAVLGVVGCVVGTTDAIEDVFAEVCCIGAGWVTSFEAEEVSTHEAGKRWALVTRRNER
jgi:hypothetical protein